MPLVLPGDYMDAEAFAEFCLNNADLRIERDTRHRIIIMPPTFSETGLINSKLHLQIGIWNEQHQLGETFDSSTGFTLPNGTVRSPGTAWVRRERWQALSTTEKQRFAAIAPDFVLELRSSDQSLRDLKAKMEEYIACGVALAWLIDPQQRQTHVYAQDSATQTVPFESTLYGGTVLPGFELVLAKILP